MKWSREGDVWDFFRARLDITYTDDFRGCLYVPEEYWGRVARMEDVAIAVGYNTFIGKTCFMHAVIQKPKYVTRSVVREVFRFPFEMCGMNHVLAPVESSNEHALDFNRRLGFKTLTVLPNGANESDLIVMQMTKAECFWLKGQQNG